MIGARRGGLEARSGRRVLVVANEEVAADELLARLRRLAPGRWVEVRVVAPALAPSRIKHGLGDIDESVAEAHGRLERSLDAIRGIGIRASGEVGESDPKQAIEDSLRTFPADELVIADHAEEEQRWLEGDALEKARHDLGLPVTHAVVRSGNGSDVASMERFVPLGTEPERPAAEELPSMSFRDLAGVVMAIGGTFALGLLALSCPEGSNRILDGGCAVRALIAVAGFLVSVFHVAALLLMGSVEYRGAWARLAAGSVVYGMPVAIVVSLLFH